ncbi:hypothetical protein R1flu_008826 [Riccia fluitans]|uniref:Uncharacterized protein n=1 Tax=Riccia fluitans TaxID=41844 RepID=A0ABD1Z2X4_9MARC
MLSFVRDADVSLPVAQSSPVPSSPAGVVGHGTAVLFSPPRRSVPIRGTTLNSKFTLGPVLCVLRRPSTTHQRPRNLVLRYFFLIPPMLLSGLD